MTKKHFIALADALRRAEPTWCANGSDVPARIQWERDIVEIAGFCREQNPRFNTGRWLDYIKGKCGPNGGNKE